MRARPGKVAAIAVAVVLVLALLFYLFEFVVPTLLPENF